MHSRYHLIPDINWPTTCIGGRGGGGGGGRRGGLKFCVLQSPLWTHVFFLKAAVGVVWFTRLADNWVSDSDYLATAFLRYSNHTHISAELYSYRLLP